MKHRARTEGPDAHELALERTRLLVLDVDEVVLHFVAPFSALLEEWGHRLHPESFRLTGNVRSISTGEAVSGGDLTRATLALYGEQERRQSLVEGSADALDRLSAGWDVVFLTAMDPAFYPHRRRLLDAAGLRFPMIATERSKGAVLAELRKRCQGPVVFVDDLPPNLHSVRRSAAEVHLIHLMANDVFRPHLPPVPAGTHLALDWPHAERIIEGIAALDP